MKEDIIINIDDQRYGKLGHLWRKYGIDNLQDENYWYVPPQLVLCDYIDSRGLRISKTPTDRLDNWVSTYSLESKLYKTCRLTVQDYYDLLILKINNRADRPRCLHPKCNTHTNFFRLTKGYAYFCCQGCASSVTMSNLNLDWWSNTRVNPYINSMEMHSKLEASKLHSRDLVSEYKSRYLYLVLWDDKFKIGTLRSYYDDVEELDLYLNSKYTGFNNRIVFLGPKHEVVDTELEIKLLNKDFVILPKSTRGWTETFPIDRLELSLTKINLPKLTI